MKSLVVILSAVSTLAAAFTATKQPHANYQASRMTLYANSVRQMPGIVAPTGFFDPLGLAQQINEETLQRYREAELAHGRFGMLAVIGFLAAEQMTAMSLAGRIQGPAISHLSQISVPSASALVIAIAAFEIQRASVGWVEPGKVPFDRPGMLRPSYSPGDLGFDPLGLLPSDPNELYDMQTKELQHGRIAMLASAGFMAQEAVDGQGIVEHFQNIL
jgi:hypothetical protein